jgi:RNA polymerase sigma-70 factor (ECF subfamily)
MESENGIINTPQPPTGDDVFLLSLIQAGDEQAVATLFDRYSGIVYSVALRVLSDPTSAEDVVQEVFLRVWRSPESFIAAGASLGGWLAVLSRNRSIDTLRRRRPTDLVDEVALTSPTNLASEAGRNSVAERARAMLQQIPDEQRKNLEMAFFDGLPYGEIAEMASDTAASVKTSIRSALLTLREGFQS